MMELRKSVPPPDAEPGSSPRASVRPKVLCAEPRRGRGLPLAVLALDIDGVLTDGRVALGNAGAESKGLFFRDLDALSQAKAAGIRVALVTGESGPLVDVIASHVGPEHLLRGAKDKHAALHELSERMGVPLGAICYVGDADRDALAFGCAGLGLAPADASPLARRRAHVVLESPGGRGAVADAVGLVLTSRAAETREVELVSAMQRIAAESLEAHRRFVEESPAALVRIASLLIRSLRGGGKVLLCGNGGSAADAQHVAGELMGRFLIEREPWPALALTTDTSILTAVGNDWTFEDVFARQVRALARPGDIVVGISTSGKSPNVLAALDAAQKKGAVRIGFTGERGGVLASHTDECFVAPAGSTPRIQELHILAWHSICEIVEIEMVSGRE